MLTPKTAGPATLTRPERGRAVDAAMLTGRSSTIGESDRIAGGPFRAGTVETDRLPDERPQVRRAPGGILAMGQVFPEEPQPEELGAEDDQEDRQQQQRSGAD